MTMVTTTNPALDAALTEALGAPAPAAPAPTFGAAFADRVMGVKRAAGAMVEVPLDMVHPDPLNARERMADIPELAASIDEQGLIQPLVVRTDGDRLVVVAGHRRLEAVRRLGWTTVEVIVRKPMPPDEVLAKMLVENGQRSGLDPIEEARALSRLKTLGGLSDDELGRKIGRSQVTVSGRLALLALPPEDQEAVRAGHLKTGAAVRMARIASGRVRKTGVGRAWHLGPDHDLSSLARARCRRLGHKVGRSVGGIACGECWESVIRADERKHQHEVSAKQGRCALCGSSAGVDAAGVLSAGAGT